MNENIIRRAADDRRTMRALWRARSRTIDCRSKDRYVNRII